MSRIVVMDDEEATATLTEYEARVSIEKATNKVDDDAKSPEEKALYTVDKQVDSSTKISRYGALC